MQKIIENNNFNKLIDLVIAVHEFLKEFNYNESDIMPFHSNDSELGVYINDFNISRKKHFKIFWMISRYQCYKLKIFSSIQLKQYIFSKKSKRILKLKSFY